MLLLRLRNAVTGVTRPRLLGTRPFGRRLQAVPSPAAACRAYTLPRLSERRPSGYCCFSQPLWGFRPCEIGFILAPYSLLVNGEYSKNAKGGEPALSPQGLHVGITQRNPAQRCSTRYRDCRWERRRKWPPYRPEHRQRAADILPRCRFPDSRSR